MIVPALDQGIEHAAVGHRHDAHPVIGADDGARVDDVLEQVIQVGPAGAREVRADVAAVAVEPVARGAGFLEDCATLAPVGRR